MLLNVVIAVLLDEVQSAFSRIITRARIMTRPSLLLQFLSFLAREKKAAADAAEATATKRRVTGVLDSITSSLVEFQDADDLLEKIDAMFMSLDSDGAGGIPLTCHPVGKVFGFCAALLPWNTLGLKHDHLLSL